jgi:hypothetical protein
MWPENLAFGHWFTRVFENERLKKGSRTKKLSF